MIYSLLFSLPGTPALYYGEEIGMGEDLEADHRMAVRTPMQWTPGHNGGFSPVDPENLTRPLVSGEFGPGNVNVSDARKDPGSLLNFITALTRRYRECIELAWGSFEVLDHPVGQVLVHRCTWEDSAVIAVHNLGPMHATLPLHLQDEEPGIELVDLLGNGTCTLDAEHTVELDLGGYGFRWLRVQRPGGKGGILPNVLTVVAATRQE